jgi:uncharacterized paraquat-inducible protein A
VSTQATDAQNAAYRAGLCVDCKAVRYSAGRPRCDRCHCNQFDNNQEATE